MVVHEFIEKLVCGFHGTKRHHTIEKNKQCQCLHVQNVTEMFVSPARNSSQYTDVQRKLHSICEQNNVKKTCQMIDSFVKLEGCNKF